MSKMKQTTLFSLKSWQKTATEDVLKCKKVLESKMFPEAVILKTLARLRQKKLSKETISSTRIGDILKMLVKDSNLKVAHEARVLIKYWNLDISVNTDTSNDVSMSQACDDDHETKSDIEIIEVQTPIEACIPIIECSKTTKDQITTTNPDLYFKDQLQSHACEDIDKSKKELSDVLGKRQITCLKTKKNLHIEAQNRKLKRRLKTTLQLFTQALGEQEVWFYLNRPSIQ